ncbi:hypothetical protein [Streptomyces sp. NPDC095613]|uniref:hypothetical protein n=1 Tax=Streptomyces sp. NPDC095613 TaxID=3155540 RepID=UPI0033329FAC
MSISLVERDYVFNALRAVTVDDNSATLPVFVLKATFTRWGRSIGFTHSPHADVISEIVRQAGYEVRQGYTSPVVQGMTLHPDWRT